MFGIDSFPVFGIGRCLQLMLELQAFFLFALCLAGGGALELGKGVGVQLVALGDLLLECPALLRDIAL
ncbi:hypothetical protein [Phytopseudomonas dryadis]|uniref:Uncharacterized protein n=1 Tax=Phytopseudomonas dryadis TaxID=2487520 RepID=A0A4Q9QWI7_9GAMM|nr:hypothetical protein [Pseudomonas dryadis]TBU86798.1 hypothetical protein DNK44_22115 [Pseudomonas dryadis]